MFEMKATKLSTGKMSQISKKIQRNLYIVSAGGGDCTRLVHSGAAHIHFLFQLLEKFQMQTASCVSGRR